MGECDTPMVWHDGRQTVSNGELFAIRDALALPPKEGETCLRIFTDSLVTLQLLWKAKYSPWRLVGHENEVTLHRMLDNIRDRVDALGDRLPVSLHKVKAHTGVVGNERADGVAKSSCETPEVAVVVDGSMGYQRRAWVTFDEGPRVTGYHGIGKGVRDHRQKAMRAEEGVSVWYAVKGGKRLDMANSAKVLWSSSTPQVVRKLVHKARFGRLAIQQNLHRWFPKEHTSPCCRLPGRAAAWGDRRRKARPTWRCCVGTSL